MGRDRVERLQQAGGKLARRKLAGPPPAFLVKGSPHASPAAKDARGTRGPARPVAIRPGPPVCWGSHQPRGSSSRRPAASASHPLEQARSEARSEALRRSAPPPRPSRPPAFPAGLPPYARPPATTRDNLRRPASRPTVTRPLPRSIAARRPAREPPRGRAREPRHLPRGAGKGGGERARPLPRWGRGPRRGSGRLGVGAGR
jgi:hypothetical protein